MRTRRNVNQLILATGLAAWTRPPSALASQPADTGPLDAPTLAVLMASAEAVTQIQPLKGYYAEYYRYQALNRDGSLARYRFYARAVNGMAARATGTDFAASPFATRVAIIGEIRASPRLTQWFERPIFQETLAVFEKSDAWLQLGYASWPGSPRGHDVYQQPI
jgi:hypothetical protein